MQNKIVFILLICSLLSCSTNSETVKIKHFNEGKIKDISIKIPNGFKEIAFKRGNNEEKQFWYPDSSVIYLTDNEVPTINYDNIVSSGNFYERIFASKFILEGVENDLYWKDIKVGNFSIGYANVFRTQKKKYDEIIANLPLLKN